ncbi:hypothetical protein KAX22_02490, partial [bacterium]|nr:hypothetical protein [bacterium]
MVCEWGMSERLGPVTFGKKEAEIFLGREIAKHRDYSEETAILIDEEVKRIVEAQERRAEAILRANVDKLHRLAKALLKREILDSFEIDEILRTKRPRPRYPRRKPHRREKETPRQGAPEGRRPLPKTSGTERKQKVWIRPKSRPQSKDS